MEVEVEVEVGVAGTAGFYAYALWQTRDNITPL